MEEIVQTRNMATLKSSSYVRPRRPSSVHFFFFMNIAFKLFHFLSVERNSFTIVWAAASFCFASSSSDGTADSSAAFAVFIVSRMVERVTSMSFFVPSGTLVSEASFSKSVILSNSLSIEVDHAKHWVLANFLKASFSFFNLSLSVSILGPPPPDMASPPATVSSLLATVATNHIK